MIDRCEAYEMGKTAVQLAVTSWYLGMELCRNVIQILLRIIIILAPVHTMVVLILMAVLQIVIRLTYTL
jgi:hypothetical protein